MGYTHTRCTVVGVLVFTESWGTHILQALSSLSEFLQRDRGYTHTRCTVVGILVFTETWGTYILQALSSVSEFLKIYME
jgi:hypothetical protein